MQRYYKDHLTGKLEEIDASVGGYIESDDVFICIEEHWSAVDHLHAQIIELKAEIQELRNDRTN